MTEITIIGMGHTLSQYFQDFSSNGHKRVGDEVWAVNDAMVWLSPRLITHGIALDSYWRDERMDNGKFKQYVANQRECGLPIYTDVADPAWPNTIAYPLKEVVTDIWPNAKEEADIIPDLENTICFALALAIHKKATQINLYGCDFRIPDNPYLVAAVADGLEDINPRWFAYHNREVVEGRRDMEPGEPTTMFLLGVAHARGIHYYIAPGSSLCNMDRGRYVYGYQEEPKIFNAEDPH